MIEIEIDDKFREACISSAFWASFASRKLLLIPLGEIAHLAWLT